MHISYPKTVAFDVEHISWAHNGKTVQVWLPRNDESVSVELPDTSYFREFRRGTFSDVSHAKYIGNEFPTLVSPNGARLFPYNFRETSEPHWGSYSSTWMRILQMEGHDCIAGNIGVRYNGSDTDVLEGRICCIWDQYRYSRSDGWKIPAVCYNFRYDFSYARGYFTRTDWSRYNCENLLSPQTVREMRDAIASVARLYDGTNGSRAKVFSLACDLLPVLLNRLKECIQTPTWDIRVDPSMFTAKPAPVSLPQLDETSFLLREPGVIMDHVPDDLYGSGTEAYFRHVLVQNAYMDLITNVPRLNDNNIQNVLSIIGLIKSVVIDHDLKMPRNLSSAWLQYRYRYGTTKMDVQDAIRFVKQHTSLPKSSYKVHGTSTLEYKGSTITCRAVASVKDRHLATVDKIWKALYTYGLSPSFYIVWDSIPLSFVVDWIVPIGTIAQVWDTESHYNQYFDIQNINFSLKYTRDIEGNHVSCYTRWLAGTPPELRGRYFFEDDPSKKTIIQRSIDLAALVIRR